VAKVEEYKVPDGDGGRRVGDNGDVGQASIEVGETFAVDIEALEQAGENGEHGLDENVLEHAALALFDKGAIDAHFPAAVVERPELVDHGVATLELAREIRLAVAKLHDELHKEIDDVGLVDVAHRTEVGGVVKRHERRVRCNGIDRYHEQNFHNERLLPRRRPVFEMFDDQMHRQNHRAHATRALPSPTPPSPIEAQHCLASRQSCYCSMSTLSSLLSNWSMCHS
jgi:hypothetical protein